MRLCCQFLLSFALSSSLWSVDNAVFLFDNGEKNMVASMLTAAEKEDKEKLNALDFQIIFMGASVDAMSKEPFCHYPEKLVHYKQLGIEETIDHTWKREGLIKADAITKLAEQLHVTKKVWVGVSCAVFGQILQYYQNNTEVEVTALRDNPNTGGGSDYFLIADNIQSAARRVAVPTKETAAKLDPTKQEIVVVGHGPTEEWMAEADCLQKGEIIQRLGLNPNLPIVVFVGSYGEGYEEVFKHFLACIPESPLQVLIAPHPRYKGILEKSICGDSKHKIIGEFETDPANQAKTIEALVIADMIITSDASSTVVLQGNALKKNLFLIHPKMTPVAESLCAKGLLQRITNQDEFQDVLNTLPVASKNDVFQILGLPRKGSHLLWQEFLR